MGERDNQINRHTLEEGDIFEDLVAQRRIPLGFLPYNHEGAEFCLDGQKLFFAIVPPEGTCEGDFFIVDINIGYKVVTPDGRYKGNCKILLMTEAQSVRIQERLELAEKREKSDPHEIEASGIMEGSVKQVRVPKVPARVQEKKGEKDPHEIEAIGVIEGIVKQGRVPIGFVELAHPSKEIIDPRYTHFAILPPPGIIEGDIFIGNPHEGYIACSTNGIITGCSLLYMTAEQSSRIKNNFEELNPKQS